ncbi:actin cytoskeleton-regulatory complex protein SLA1, partial [Tremellales sp. Uapishka_1]
MAYVAVVKALYDYTAQDPEGELSFKEDQIIYVVDKEDEDWWKAKLKEDGAAGAEGSVGLIPATYVEEIPPLNQTRALYAYDSTSPDELSIVEDGLLHVYSIEEDWLLVRSDEGGKLGFVPRTYCEVMDASTEVEVEDASQAAAEVEHQREAEREESKHREIAAKQRELKLKDKIETWSISALEGKKKKKGSLGVGNGAIFFASESDKAPVVQFQITDLTSVSQPSSKLLDLSISTLPEPLHFHCGSSDVGKAIIAKLESSKTAAGEALELTDAIRNGGASSGEEEEYDAPVPAPAAAAPKAVRWASTTAAPATGGAAATVLYDFDAQGEDELTVHEGEALIVVDKENEEWWTVRNERGEEGVVPAQYIELGNGSSSAPHPEDDEDDDDEDGRREEETAAAAAAAAASVEAARREERARKVEERRAIEEAASVKAQREAEDHAMALKLEQDERAKRDRRERRREEEVRRRREEEATARREAARQQAPPKISKRPTAEDVEIAASHLPSTNGRRAPEKPAEANRPKPNPSRTRVWNDKSGQFKVEAEFLGMNGAKIRLHKLNGVIIEVPLEKMSNEDNQLIKRHLAKKQREAAQAKIDEDDLPLSNRSTPVRRSQPSEETRRRAESPIPAAAMEMPKARKPRFDWFEFFLSAGCDMDDCTRYAMNFERDRIDDTLLPDLEASTMRSLGLKEGDVIRVRKTIQARTAKKTPEQLAQIKLDEEYAKQLQSHENAGGKGPVPAPPRLFESTGGKLANNTRRGRPEKKSTGPDSVDSSAFAAVSDQLSRTTLVSPSPPPAPSPPPQPKPAPSNGFDDDAWTIRPTSTKPTSPPPPQAAPALDPTQNLLRQIENLRPASTGVSSQNTGGSFDLFPQMTSPQPPQQQQQRAPSAPILPSQTGYGAGNYGLGMQNQNTPMAQMQTGARGPLAPVPQNAELLNPLQPSQTGMFVPTRGNGQQQQQQQQPQFTGMMPQQTGYLPQQQPPQMMSQPTGYQQGFQQGYGQQPMQPIQPSESLILSPGSCTDQRAGYTGYPGGFQNSTFNAIASIGPPPPPAQPQGDKFAPTSIFAAMKQNQFGKPEEEAPQNSSESFHVLVSWVGH